MSKPLLFIDFETQSEINIKECGSYKYVNGSCFRPICMAMSTWDSDVDLWTYKKRFPVDLLQQYKLAAFNVEFEYNVLKSKWFEYNDYDMSWLTIDDFVDVQAVGRLFGYPGSLDKLAKVLGVKHQKDAKGTKLINQLCVVKNFSPLDYEDKPKAFDDLYSYCRQDVRTTRACLNALVKQNLSPTEHAIFSHMMLQNQRGLPVDFESARKIRAVLEKYKEYYNKEIDKLTGGRITAGTQHQAIADYIRNHGYHEVTSIAAPIVEDILANKKLDSHCRKLLKLRKAVSHSSTAKFKRIVEMAQSDHRVRGNLKYHVGHTGRFAGTGVQIHNLPRAKVDDPDAVIQDFFDLDLYELMDKYGNVGETASKLIRPMVKAPEGKLLCVADYVSIENVCLHWMANDQQTVEDFTNKLDQYKTYASRRFSVPYDEVTKEQRTYAKPCVLGLGYGGGPAALQRVAAGYGVELSYEEADEDKHFYRNTFSMIPDLWYKVNSYMLSAVRRGTTLQLNTGTTNLKFIGRRGYGFIILPSGRFLAYPHPKIQIDSQYGRPCLTYMGIDPYTKKWRRLGDQHRVIDGEVVPDMPIHGGRLVENIIQATARDLLVNGALWAEKLGYEIIGTVHDEVLAEVDETVPGNTLDHFCSAICTLPKWAEGIPLRAEGYLAKRYRKD